jgi:hypothetical protein
MFTLKQIESTAESILSKDPDAVVRFRLLRDVLMVPASGVEYRQAKKAMLQSHWVEKLEEEQWENGSWGRFHTENTKIKSRYPTTEFAIRRGLELGLDKKDKVFVKAIRYMTDVLEDRVRWSDGYEKSPCFPIAVKLFTAAELSQITPSHRALEPIWDIWSEIFRRTFAGGEYDQEAERAASEDLLGVNINRSYVAFHSKYNLRFMGSRSDRIPERMQEALLKPLWNGEIGLGYLRHNPSGLPKATTERDFTRWLESVEVLSGFRSWKRVAEEGIRWLWDECQVDDLWDCSPQRGRTPYFPLSESWRKRGDRRIDCSTRILVLLRKWFV